MRPLGKREAVLDHRVPRLMVQAGGLPPPPAESNWYAGVPEWGMLANDRAGCCVDAAILHMIWQQRCYTGAPNPPPTDEEALAFYSANTGYDPSDPLTDQGSYVLGPNGALQYWLTHGVTCGGVPNHPAAFMQVHVTVPMQWRRAIHYFGSAMIGLRLPESIAAGPEVPFVWRDPSGPVAGGHEVLAVGYQTVGTDVLYDIVSWGARYRVTEAFLLGCMDEIVCVYDRESFLARGISPAGISEINLLSQMTALRSA